jgi:hypothetical protein
MHGDATTGRAIIRPQYARRRTRTHEARLSSRVVLGRPRSTPADVVARVVRERTEGKTAYAIARDLNKDAAPTAQGASAGGQRVVAVHCPRATDAGAH